MYDMSEYLIESQSAEEESRNDSRRSRHVVVLAGKSPSIPKQFFSVCLVGIVLIMGGFLAIAWALSIDDYDQYEFREDLTGFGMILTQLGGLLLALGLLSAGFLARDISQNTRMGLIVSSSLILGLLLLRITLSTSRFG